MRTIASTFSTLEEAETASRRLQSIGVAPEAILLKDLAETGSPSDADLAEAKGRAGEARGIFISAKVSPEQVGAATEILKGGTREDAPPQSPIGGDRPDEERTVGAGEIQAQAAAASAPRPVGRVDLPPGSISAAPGPRHVGSPDTDWRRWSRRIVIFCLVLFAAFMVGAVLGLVI